MPLGESLMWALVAAWYALAGIVVWRNRSVILYGVTN